MSPPKGREKRWLIRGSTTATQSSTNFSDFLVSKICQRRLAIDTVRGGEVAAQLRDALIMSPNDPGCVKTRRWSDSGDKILARFAEDRMRRFVEGADRGQTSLFPECLEDWIGEDNPVRVVDAFVDE